MVQRKFQYCTSAEELSERVRSYNPNSDSELITSAYLYSQKMHAPQLRRSGEPYFTHPRAVASILADQRLDDTTIATALLHDTLEDTRSTEKELTARFGKTIAGLVDGVTKLTNITTVSVEAKEAENFRKLLLAVSKDPRVIVVKLADRLHNMKTIRHLPGEKRTRKARETMDVYAPLAGRMGMQWMREELENLAFREMDPLEHKALLLRFAKMRREHPHLMEEIISEIRNELERVGVKAEVEGRAKKPYSAWRKLKEEKRDFSALSDVLGFRVITSSADDIYKALGAIHLKWKGRSRTVQGLRQPSEIERLQFRSHRDLGQVRPYRRNPDQDTGHAPGGRDRGRCPLVLPGRATRRAQELGGSGLLDQEPDRELR